MSIDLFSFIIECAILLLLAPYVERFSRNWMQSFAEWQEYEEQRLTKIQMYSQQLEKWEKYAQDIESGKYNLPPEIADNLGKCARERIEDLQGTLTQLREEDT